MFDINIGTAFTFLFAGLGCFFLLFLLSVSGAIVFIPNNKYGIIERRWSINGKRSQSFMSENGSPGFLPHTVVGGWHFFVPFQFKVHRKPLITVSEIGYLFARTGANLPSGQALASWPTGVSPENAEEFLNQGGQRGPQRFILRGGSYSINTALFAVITDAGVYQTGSGDDLKEITHLANRINNQNGFDPVIIGEDSIAVVTVQDGPSLEHGDVIAPTVGEGSVPGDLTFHNGFQDIDAFLKAGGRRGNQEQVLTEGTYYINRLFATVEIAKKTVVPVGSVGVVNSFTGKIAEALSDLDKKDNIGATFVVPHNYRGIWSRALGPGKYAYNPFAYNIKTVPTTNFQLRWISIPSNTRDFDAGLSEIKLITKDAFEPILPLTIVVNILPDDAPKVIQQFSDVLKLVNETLDPMVSAWFKDSAQSKTLLELVTNRSELQADALEAMSEKFKRYHLNVREVMIGTPRPDVGDDKIGIVFDQLRKRQIAIESATTYVEEEKTAGILKGLNEAKAIAQQQTDLTASKVAIDIAKNNAQGKLEAQKLEAEAITALAGAEAQKIKLIGEAEAQSLSAQADAVGGAEAILRKTIMQIFMDGLQKAGQPIVPSVMLGENQSGGNQISDILATCLLRDGKLDDIIK